MLKNGKIFLTILLPVLFLVGCGSIRPDHPKDLKPPLLRGEAKGGSSTFPISRIFVDPQVFRSTDRLQSFNFKGQPIAGVVNHHILANDLIARFFKTLRAVRPDIETIIILSPDHFSQGRGLSTHELTYVTLAGDVAVNKPWVLELEKIGVWDGTDSRAFENEHGIGALAPFIAREFPGVKIVTSFPTS